jgi:hypothetical protein
VSLSIELRSLQRFWSTSRGSLRFQVTGSSTVGHSVDELIELSTEIEGWLHEEGNETHVGGWVSTPTGSAAVMRNAHHIDDGLAWLERFVSAYGPTAEGRIVGGPREATDVPFGRGPHLSAFVAYTTEDLLVVNPRHRVLWNMEGKYTRHLCAELVNWSYSRGAAHYLTRLGDTIEVRGADAGDALAASVAASGTGRFFALKQAPFLRRGGGFADAGTAVYQYANADLTWRELANDLRSTLGWLSRHTDLAFLRYHDSVTSWMSPKPDWPFAGGAYISYVRPLLKEFVPDVHGIQLLTARHLERARDLSRWTITDLPGNRYLVEAPDPSPWYAEALPEPAVLQQGRHDFGDMLLTKEAVRDHNPWPPGDLDHGAVLGLLRADDVPLG